MRKIISTCLACLMIISLCTPANAAGTLISTEGKGTSPLSISADAASFDVSIPLALPVHIDGMGRVSTATDATILNKACGKVRISAINFEVENGWNFIEYGSDVSNMAVGTKAVGLKIAGGLGGYENVSLAKGIYNDSEGNMIGDVNEAFSAIPAASYAENGTTNGMALNLKYSATVPAQKEAIESSETAANVIFTIIWEEDESSSTVTGSDTLTWDGDTTGKVSFTIASLVLYKVSDAVPTKDDFANGCTLKATRNTGDVSVVPIEDGTIIQNAFLEDGFLIGDGFMFVPTDNYDYEGSIIPEAGTYFMLTSNTYLSYLQIPGYTGF